MLYEGYLAQPLARAATLMNRFRLVDVARKVVGVGSVGTRCWIALFEGGADDDPLLLQIKEAQTSVLEHELHRRVDLPPPRRAGRARPAADAGGQRPLPRVVDQPGHRRPLLLAPAARHEGSADVPALTSIQLANYTPRVRLGAGPGPRPQRRRRR